MLVANALGSNPCLKPFLISLVDHSITKLFFFNCLIDASIIYVFMPKTTETRRRDGNMQVRKRLHE